MDDDQLTGDVIPDSVAANNPEAQPQMVGPPPEPPTWNQADEIRLQNVNNAKAHADDQFGHKVWGQDTYDSIVGQINPQRAALLARKQAAAQYQQQQQTAQVLNQSALADGVRAHQMQTNAKLLPTQIQELFNPNTGGIDRFYQSEPGKWDVLESQPVQASPELAGGEGGGSEGSGPAGPAGTDVAGPPPPPLAPDGQPYGDQPRYRTVAGADGVQRQQRIPTAAEFAAMQAATPEQQVAIADRINNGTFGGTGTGPTMSIQSGPYSEQFQGGQLTATNRPAPPSQNQSAGGPEDFYRRAQGIVGQPPPQFYRGPHGQQLPNPQYGQWLRDVRATATELHKEHRQQQQFGEHQRQEQAKEAAKTKAQEEGQRKTAYDQTYEKKLAELQADRDQYTKGDPTHRAKEPPGGLPPYLKEREAMEQEAFRRADRQFLGSHGTLPAHRQAAAEAERQARQQQQQRAQLTPEEQKLYQRIAVEHGAEHGAATQRGTPEEQRQRVRERTAEDLKRTGGNPSGGGVSPWRIFGSD